MTKERAFAWFTDPCVRQCEERSHQPGGNVPLTSTEAPHLPPARTKEESADLWKWYLFNSLHQDIQKLVSFSKGCMSCSLICVLNWQDYRWTGQSSNWTTKILSSTFWWQITNKLSLSSVCPSVIWYLCNLDTSFKSVWSAKYIQCKHINHKERKSFIYQDDNEVVCL